MVQLTTTLVALANVFFFVDHVVFLFYILLSITFVLLCGNDVSSQLRHFRVYALRSASPWYRAPINLVPL